MASTTSSPAEPSTQQPGLRPNSAGLVGTVIMSAAIMGPAVPTFFNPQFSTPFSGFATVRGAGGDHLVSDARAAGGEANQGAL